MTLAQSLIGIAFGLGWFFLGYCWRWHGEREREAKRWESLLIPLIPPRSFDSEPEEVPGGHDLEESNV